MRGIKIPHYERGGLCAKGGVFVGYYGSFPL